MAVRRLIIVASALLCGWVFLVAGCGSSDATVATVTAETSGLYPVSVDGKWGFIDKTGTIKIQPQYEFAMPFSEGLAMVRLNGKWGYIDTSGTMVIQPQFDDAHPFSDGLATVGKFSEDGPLFGYIDKTGALVIPMRYGFPSDFSKGLCMVLVEENGTQTSGYIDKTGTMVIEPEFTMAGDFSEGLAGVMSAADNSRCGYIDKNGDWVIELPGNLLPGGRLGEEGFSESLAVVRELILDDPEAGGFRYGYVDTTGAVVIQPQFDGAFDFSEGLAVVAVKENGATKYGYIDKTGAWVIQPQFDNAGFFSEGLAAVGVRTSGTDSDPTWITDYSWGYIDKTGTLVIPMQYQTADAFSGGVHGWRTGRGWKARQALNSSRRPTSTRPAR